jgi:hypothetical protein
MCVNKPQLPAIPYKVTLHSVSVSVDVPAYQVPRGVLPAAL